MHIRHFMEYMQKAPLCGVFPFFLICSIVHIAVFYSSVLFIFNKLKEFFYFSLYFLSVLDIT